MDAEADLQQRLQSLRQDFDASFAREARSPDLGGLSLLLLRSGGLAHAVALSELQAIDSTPPLARLPGQHPAFLGLAGIDGRPMAVYARARLLGLPEDERPRWILVGQAQVAVAVSEIIGQAQARREDMHRDVDGQPGPTVVVAGTCYPLLELTVLLRTLLAPAP